MSSVRCSLKIQSILNSKSPCLISRGLCRMVSPEKIQFQCLRIEIVSPCSNPSISLKIESCHDANFGVTGTTSDDKVGTMTIIGFQCYDTHDSAITFAPRQWHWSVAGTQGKTHKLLQAVWITRARFLSAAQNHASTLSANKSGGYIWMNT